MIQQARRLQRLVLATPPIYQAPLPLEVHLPMIPQGPAMIAAVLRTNGHHVTCFDAYERSCRRGYFDASEFADFLIAERPDWLGLSVYSDGYPSALAMIEIAKTVLPSCSVIVGGPHFTIFPDAVPPEVDYVVAGEGELPMLAFVEGWFPESVLSCNEHEIFFSIEPRDSDGSNDQAGNLRFHLVEKLSEAAQSAAVQTIPASMSFAGNGRSKVLRMRGRLSNEVLGCLPYPAYDLFLSAEASYQFDEPALGLDGPMLNLNTSRGCSYGCSFCSVEGVWGKSYSWFPTRWILGLVADLQQRYGLRSVFFREDEFIMRPRARSAWREDEHGRDEVLALAQGLHALGIRWAVENRADGFGSPDRAEDYFKTLARLGLAGVFVGVESASEKVRNKILNKHLPEAKLRAFFKWSHEVNVRTVANVMYGVRRRVGNELLSDNREDWVATEVLLAEINPTRIDRYVYVGVPVSPMYFDHLDRSDYDLIDVNGYLYPKGFGDLAREIYKHDIEMTIVRGRPNLRVGPGLLPGIPAAETDLPLDIAAVAAAITRLKSLPGILELTLTPLCHGRTMLLSGFGVHGELLKRLSCRHLPAPIATELLKCYRPTGVPAIHRLTNGPTLAIASIRTPSAEVVLLALQLAHDVSSFEPILSALAQTTILVNNYLRSEFVRRFGPRLGPMTYSRESRNHLKVVGR